MDPASNLRPVEIAEILVVTDRAITIPIAKAIQLEASRIASGREPRVRVIASEFVRSQSKRITGEIDDASGLAASRLARSIKSLAEVGIEASSYGLGDEDPVLAVGDELRRSPRYEHVIVVPYDEGSVPQEMDLLARVAEEVDVAVSEIELNDFGLAKVHRDAGKPKPERLSLWENTRHRARRWTRWTRLLKSKLARGGSGPATQVRLEADGEEDKDGKVDAEGKQSFPASDPPGNY